MQQRQIACAAFITGIPALLLAPFAIIGGIAYLRKLAGLAADPLDMSIPVDWGLGGVLYCFGLVVWLGYAAAGSCDLSTKNLRRFWRISLGLNTLWAIFFAATLAVPGFVSLHPSVWAVSAPFALVELYLSYLGVWSCTAAAA